SSILTTMTSLLLLQQRIEALERFVPELLVARHPLVRALERRGAQRTELLTSFLALFDQAGALQIGQVLRDRLLRHPERLGQLVDRGRTLAQPLENDSPRRIGQRQKSEVERIHNHMVVYSLVNVNSAASGARGAPCARARGRARSDDARPPRAPMDRSQRSARGFCPRRSAAAASRIRPGSPLRRRN